MRREELQIGPKLITGVVGVLVIAFGVVSFREDQGALFVGVLTVGVTAAGIWRQQENERAARLDQERRDRESKREEDRRDHKIKVYSSVIDTWFDLLLGDEQQKAKLYENLERTMGAQVKGLIPWASDDVVSVFSRLRTFSMTGENPLEIFAEMLLSIRRDLGHANDGLDPYVVATMFVKELSRDSWRELLDKSVGPHDGED